MWFKQCSWFDLQSPLLLEGDALEEALSMHKAYDPHATQSKSMGFESPLGEGQPLAIVIPGYTWLSARLDQKLLPANVINHQLKRKLSEIELHQGFPVTGKQRRSARDDLILDLLPKAFVQSKRINIVIDERNQVLMIDQTSANIKDMTVELLKKALGECPMTHHLDQKSQIGHILKNWVTQPPEQVEIESEYSLINPNNVHVKARMIGLEESLVIAPLQSGMSVSQLTINYDNKMRFQLKDQLDFSRIRYLDVEQVDDCENPIEQMIADFTLSISYLSEIITACKSWFPIEVKEETLDVVE
jgi:recombination associated protein RdgC